MHPPFGRKLIGQCVGECRRESHRVDYKLVAPSLVQSDGRSYQRAQFAEAFRRKLVVHEDRGGKTQNGARCDNLLRFAGGDLVVVGRIRLRVLGLARLLLGERVPGNIRRRTGSAADGAACSGVRLFHLLLAADDSSASLPGDVLLRGAGTAVEVEIDFHADNDLSGAEDPFKHHADLALKFTLLLTLQFALNGRDRSPVACAGVDEELLVEKVREHLAGSVHHRDIFGNKSLHRMGNEVNDRFHMIRTDLHSGTETNEDGGS